MAILFQKTIDKDSDSQIFINKNSYGMYIKEGWIMDVDISSPMSEENFATRYNSSIGNIYRRPVNIPSEMSLNYCVKNITNIDKTCGEIGRLSYVNNKFMVVEQ